MKTLLVLAFSALTVILAGCDSGPATGSTIPGQITPEQQAEMDAHDKAVEAEEQAR